MTECHYDYLIVGCGIVGCAVARELCLRGGVTVGIVEKESDPVAEASSGNTGHIGTFFYYTDARQRIYSAPHFYSCIRQLCSEAGQAASLL